jgi:hypothetical protein
MTPRARVLLALAVVVWTAGLSASPASARSRFDGAARSRIADRSLAARSLPRLSLPRVLPPRGTPARRGLAAHRPPPLPGIEGTDVGPDWTIPDHYAGSCEPGPEENFETRTCDPPDGWEP